MKNPKWLHTMEIYDEYERGIARARADKPLILPIGEKRRNEVISETKKILFPHR